MSQRLTNILGYLTLFALMGAVWVLFGEDPTREQGGRGEPTFAGMVDRINDVHVVEIQQNGQTTTLTRTAERWSVKERDGYWADSDKVIALLRGVALSERREPKTANAERLPRIGLGAEATKISLRDSEGELMLAFDTGKRSATSADRSLTYIWQERDTRSWLVTALAETANEPVWWLDTDLLDISDKRFKSVRIADVTLERALGEPEFALGGLSGDEKAVAFWQLAEPARSLAEFSFEDVRRLGNPLNEPLRTVLLTTHDGLKLSFRIYSADGAHWAQIEAVFDEAGRSQGEEGMLPDAPVDGAVEASDLMTKTRGWFFKLSDRDADILMRNRADFIEKPEKAADEGP